MPRIDGVELRRIGRGGRRWLLIHTINGRTVETVLNTYELRGLVELGAQLLERDEGDV